MGLCEKGGDEFSAMSFRENSFLSQSSWHQVREVEKVLQELRSGMQWLSRFMDAMEEESVQTDELELDRGGCRARLMKIEGWY